MYPRQVIDAILGDPENVYPDSVWQRPPMSWNAAFTPDHTQSYRMARQTPDLMSLGLRNAWRAYADPMPLDFADVTTYERRVPLWEMTPKWLDTVTDVGDNGAQPYLGRYMPPSDIEIEDKVFSTESVFGPENWGKSSELWTRYFVQS